TVGVAIWLVSLVVWALVPITAQQTASGDLHSGRFQRHGARAIPNHYIVVLDRDVTVSGGDVDLNDRQVAELMRDWAGTVTRRFDHALNGFAAFMTEAQALRLSEDPRVALVEEDSTVEMFATQSNPPWGLDRIGQRDLPLNHSYSYTTTGAG